MCQCLICDCWWCNYCGACDTGISMMYCCIGIWCCRPDKLEPAHSKGCYCF